jgi:hypothetical protein
LKPKKVVFVTAFPLAFQAPSAFPPFLLPAVSFLPVHLELERSERLKITIGIDVRPSKALGK